MSEVTIKHALGKLPLPEDPATWLPNRRAVMGVTPLAFDERHALAVAGLLPLHRDPFDRALVAVAAVEALQLVTADPAIARYDVDVRLLPSR